ncbi:hypothetical protein F5890DRAFT_1540421 [Lentinula detonsa]|uniref:Uncharacterized protein n=1 Tax=Lentinula detonsa TaxID=2804962 RepID=A0AA38PS33_9AGAR|nr:hypothetical protein F5890DRAFT_1540421 [Lentinula detonsa]
MISSHRVLLKFEEFMNDPHSIIRGKNGAGLGMYMQHENIFLAKGEGFFGSQGTRNIIMMPRTELWNRDLYVSSPIHDCMEPSIPPLSCCVGQWTRHEEPYVWFMILTLAASFAFISFLLTLYKVQGFHQSDDSLHGHRDIVVFIAIRVARAHKS